MKLVCILDCLLLTPSSMFTFPIDRPLNDSKFSLHKMKEYRQHNEVASVGYSGKHLFVGGDGGVDVYKLDTLEYESTIEVQEVV